MLIMAGTFALGLVVHFIVCWLEGDFDPEQFDGDDYGPGPGDVIDGPGEA